MRVARLTQVCLLVTPIVGRRDDPAPSAATRRRSAHASRPLTALLVTALFLSTPVLTACGDDGDNGPTTAIAASQEATSAGSTSESRPPSTGALDAGGTDVDRAVGHIHQLTTVIGPRPAGSLEEITAAEYLAEQLEAMGYTAELDKFTFAAERDNSLVSVGDGFLLASAMRGSPNGEASGEAVFAGLGEPNDLAGASLDGNVVIFDRGMTMFHDKALAAQAGGAIAVLIVNNEPGAFFGSLGEDADITIPVLSINGDDREILQHAIGQNISVVADAGTEMATSQNVVGRLGDRCHAYVGAHYDSVPVGPGANDNASGVAVVLEAARVQHVQGLCVVFFGAEEVGLFGSRHYVEDNLVGMARFMLNVDMAGRLEGPMIIGNEELTELIMGAAPDSPLRPGVFPPFASSDHAPFAAVGVPAVTLTGGLDDALHTPLDTIERIDGDALQIFMDVLVTSIDALVEQHSGVLSR